MKIKSTEIADTYAEAFKMTAARVIITAATRQWARAAARSMTGFATSVIGCKCEAGIECELPAEASPDLRPAVSVLLFAMDRQSLGKRLVERIGQCVMTCPSTACYNGLSGGPAVTVGGRLRYFGDGWQLSKVIGGRRLWRIPVMDGEFLLDDRFNLQDAVGGGNLLLLARDQETALRAAAAAVKAMRSIPDIILPFPNGVARSGSKPGSRYKSLIASTNESWCPTLRGVAANSRLEAGVNGVLEIVIDGLTLEAVQQAMRTGMAAAARPGVKKIAAGNYGGGLGQYQIHLRALWAGLAESPAE